MRDSSGCLGTANPDHCTLQKASSKSCTHKISPVKGVSLCHRLQTLQVIPQALMKTNRTLAHPFHLQQVTLVGLEVQHDLSKGKTKGIWSHRGNGQLENPRAASLWSCVPRPKRPERQLHSLNLISTLDRRGLDRKQISKHQSDEVRC